MFMGQIANQVVLELFVKLKERMKEKRSKRKIRNIGKSEVFGGNNFKIYFEEDNFDQFADKLKEYDIENAEVHNNEKNDCILRTGL